MKDPEPTVSDGRGTGPDAARTEHSERARFILGREVWLVSGREISARLRSRAFIFSALVLVLLVVGGIVVSNVVSSTIGMTRVAVTADALQAVTGLPLVQAVETASSEEAISQVRSGTVAAAVVTTGGAVEVVALERVPAALVSALSVSPHVTLLEPSTQDSGLLYLVALVFGIVYLMSAVTFGSMIAQSVVEEKQTRVIEILLSAVSSRTVLAGKVIGNSAMAFAQIALTAVAAIGALVVTGQAELASTLGPSTAWFVLFFIIGFVLLAALFAASASLVSRQEDVSAVTTPVMMLVMVPYFLVLFLNTNAGAMAVMSYVPFSSPLAMPMRLFLGNAQPWELVISLALVLATTVVVVFVGARIYDRAVLRTGGRVRLSEVLKG
ncbi:ABC transporter permease [Rathayibacter toxicus]|uniref:ABC transporter permease n=1 Tax=Rathayibacter toxicus TaxID=145458 RepID=UPI001E2F2B4C|nr:ABC transporter permease [Rathayibacter toxicus]